MMRTVFPPYYCHARAILALVTIRGHLQSSVSMDVTSPSSISGNSYPFFNFLKETHPRSTLRAILGCLKFKFSKLLL